MRTLRKSVLVLAMAIGLIAAWMPTSSAISVSISPSTTRNSGQLRAIGAAWGEDAPYNVNFQCGAPGCANFVSTSTNVTSLGRSYRFSTCIQNAHTHTITVRESTGGRLSASSTTTWLPGPCR